jgi:hypothetical protein
MFGFINTPILLPTVELAEDELRFIFKHELVHYKRKDLWYKMLVLTATAIHWFNPFVYLIAKAINVQCELSCDAEIVRNTDADTRLQYSETIIGIIKYRSNLKTALSTNFYGGKKGMKNRVSSIMDTSKKKAGIAIICAVLLITFTTGFVFAVNASEAQPNNRANVDFSNHHIVAIESNEAQLNNDGGQSWLINNGQTWQSLEPNDSFMVMLGSGTFSISEYEKMIEELKSNVQMLADAFNFSSTEEVNRLITYMEEQLVISKRNGSEEIVLNFNSGNVVGSVTVSGITKNSNGTFNMTVSGITQNANGAFILTNVNIENINPH